MKKLTIILSVLTTLWLSYEVAGMIGTPPGLYPRSVSGLLKAHHQYGRIFPAWDFDITDKTSCTFYEKDSKPCQDAIDNYKNTKPDFKCIQDLEIARNASLLGKYILFSPPVYDQCIPAKELAEKIMDNCNQQMINCYHHFGDVAFAFMDNNDYL